MDPLSGHSTLLTITYLPPLSTQDLISSPSLELFTSLDDIHPCTVKWTPLFWTNWDKLIFKRWKERVSREREEENKKYIIDGRRVPWLQDFPYVTFYNDLWHLYLSVVVKNFNVQG